MIMKGMISSQAAPPQPQQQLVDENMSNLTSASGEASVSSNQQANSAASPNPNPTKKKRNLPGNPDPEAEVIALSPKTLMATNRFVCEICCKGFQRDQNLQLHRRGHNLPWKLKQRNSKEPVRKKVYVCPESTCVHHDPARALGDLTGIKKHFSRKHGEKKWKCDKCSKKYAVQSDWKAHSKVCGTREYRCDCGTLFSRRDSFITHRAFCDALAEESARAIAAVNHLAPTNHHQHPLLFPQSISLYEEQHSSLPHVDQADHLSLKMEPQNNHIPPWLTATSLSQLINHQQQFPPPPPTTPSPLIFSTRLEEQPAAPVAPPFQATAHMSATALLQKAAEMGATMSRPHHLGLMAAADTSGFGLVSSKSIPSPPHLPLGQEYMVNTMTNTVASSTPCDLDERNLEVDHFLFGEMPGSKREQGSRGMNDQEGVCNIISGNGDGMTTRDFLGLKAAFPHRDILNLTELDPNCLTSSSSSYDQYRQRKMKPWYD
ncbi:protein indeterminate-domain 7-like [Curcuma longa]|uniref:protein indeterminate-domain 7-like n=1 Tax=Curcuma longa TaxID=136217 RepID=UPI003D9EE753